HAEEVAEQTSGVIRTWFQRVAVRRFRAVEEPRAGHGIEHGRLRRVRRCLAKGQRQDASVQRPVVDQKQHRLVLVLLGGQRANRERRTTASKREGLWSVSA